jgi:hypothetical protein
MNNYEILGRPTGESIDDTLAYLETRRIPKALARLEERASESRFLFAQTWFLHLLALIHLGASSSRPPAETVKTASELARDYFSKPWYRSDPDDAEVMRKEPDNEDLKWFHMFTTGLLMAALADDQKTLEILGDWLEYWLVPEFADPPTDPLLGNVFISIGAAFRSTPLEELKDVEAAIHQSRKKQPKLLFQTWEAVRDKDQPAFEDALLQSTRHFEKTMREPSLPVEAVAFYQSVVLAIARHYGLSLPNYEPPIMARLVCHESLGIALPTNLR